MKQVVNLHMTIYFLNTAAHNQRDKTMMNKDPEYKFQPAELESILRVTTFFSTPFSVDWIQELTHLKTSSLLKITDYCCREGIFEKQGIDMFCFIDEEKRREIQKSVTPRQSDVIGGEIADLLWRNLSVDPSLRSTLADHMLQTKNTLKGCKRLKEIADHFRINGPPGRSLQCFKKIFENLEPLEGNDVDRLFIESVISYSKDYSSIDHPKQVIAYLEAGLNRDEKLDDKLLRTLLLFSLAIHEWIMGNSDAADRYHQHGKKLAAGIVNPQIERFQLTIKLMNLSIRGRFKEFVEAYESIEPVFQQKYPGHRHSLLFGSFLGIAYCFLGQVSQARGVLNAIYVSAKKSHNIIAYGPAAATLGLTFVFSHDFERGKQYLKKQLSELIVDDSYGRCLTLFFLAYTHLKTGEPEEAARLLEDALRISLKNSYKLTGYGFIFDFAYAIETGKMRPTLNLNLKEHVEWGVKSDSIFIQGLANRYAAILARQDNEPKEKILSLLQQSLDLLTESGNEKEAAITALELGTALLRSGQTERAREHLENGSRVLMDIDRDYALSAAKMLFAIDGKAASADTLELIDSSRARENVFEELFSLGQRVMSSRSPQEVVQIIFSTVNRLSGAERGAIFLKKKDAPGFEIELWAAKNIAPRDITAADFQEAKAAIHRAIQSGQIQTLSSNMGNPDTESDNLAIKSFICVPLVYNGDIMGCLYHDNQVLGTVFRENDSKVLSYFASFAATALDNAINYEKIQSLNQRLNEEKQYYEIQHLESMHYGDLVVASDAMKNVLGFVDRVADTDSTVLITGETGVGKEVIARAIHRLSSRSDKPFISVNCGTMPRNLVPSELFGHEKGAFTGAISRHLGRFELADGGTLFLDEIGELPLDVQVNLLRVLETKQFERVGGRESLRSDFRLLAATNRELEKDVGKGRFRSDLYYRLNVFPIIIPPLRERKDDILPLAAYFLDIHAEKMQKTIKGICQDDTDNLTGYHWPGNVRELENIIERSVILNSEDTLRIPTLGKAPVDSKTEDIPLTAEENERRLILETLRKTHGRLHGKGGAAELLGLKRSTLYYRMKKLGIDKGSIFN